ncbi:PREDICTED: transmembrane protease serine 9-like [Wasmannia auropunctata]|uniref:transmembrane protease serine 9-like n=1 Tax=Wasmannia auropunctata TaxID=64793 RepID=UPI0005EDABD1|nr:PREDICTED: transmembrane protease serine 9-like [Wasmannia auropunctata]
MLIRCLLATVLVFQACLAVPFGLKPRITDGEDAIPGEFPYQVSVHWGFPPFIRFNHACGGSIINERFILTAGHCVMKFGKLKVFAGKHSLLDREPTVQEIDVVKTIVHENYPGGVAPYDIALLKLKTPLTFNERVSPVNLPQQDEVITGNAVLSGWGSTSKKLLPVLPKVLQKVTVPLLDHETCQEKFTKGPDAPKVYDSQICTEAVGEVSACSGDSGGPLVKFVNKNYPVQVGIVSWGVYPCGVNKMPSVYTRVAFYINWIQMTIWLENLNYQYKLQHVKMEYVDRKTCHEAVEDLTGSSPVHETNVCTGPLYDQISACSGDSGGPLISRNGQKPVLTGIVSWGIIPCGSAGAPSVYTRVSKFNSWIAQKIGSILNENWIVTAGHCVQAVPSINLLRVKAGKHDIRRNEDTEQTVQVVEGIIHENYGGDVGPYDIALLKLASPLKLSNEVQAIELAEPESDPTGEAWLCGWGSTSTTRLPKMPDKLQHVKMEYVDRKTCHDAVEDLTGSSPVHETNVCTGPLYDQISACSGDSGGPLISRNGQKAVLTGIVSWGIIPCGTAGAPSVYTRVSKFNSWIEQKTGSY